MCTVLVTALSRVTHLDLLFKTAFSPYFVNLLFCLVLFSETKSHVDHDSLQTTLCLKMTMNQWCFCFQFTVLITSRIDHA